jgi:undecaprenol kinase
MNFTKQKSIKVLPLSKIAVKQVKPTDVEKRAELRKAFMGSSAQRSFKAKNFFQSVGFALEGLYYVFKTERNFRIDTFAALLTIALGVYVSLTPQDWVPVLMMIGLVLVAELTNSVLESSVDIWTKGQYDIRAKRIKDVAAAACLTMACSAAIVGACTFYPYLQQKF